MSAIVTQLDDHRPSLLARARSAMRAWWAGLTDLPDFSFPGHITAASTITVARRQKPLNWPLRVDENFDELALAVGRARQLTFRTRDGHRGRLSLNNDGDTSVYPLRGEIELLDDCSGCLEWHGLGWNEDGTHSMHEHAWDLVSVETASCVLCDQHDLRDNQKWWWLTVDRFTGLGVCSACTGEAA